MGVRHLMVGAWLCGVIWIPVGCGGRDKSSGLPVSPAAPERQKELARSTALVEVVAVENGRDRGWTGNAFCVDRSGLFVTHARIAELLDRRATQARLILGGDEKDRRVIEPKLVRVDDDLELALLRVDVAPGLVLEPLALGKDSDLSEGMEVEAFGFPEGMPHHPIDAKGQPVPNPPRFHFLYGVDVSMVGKFPGLSAFPCVVHRLRRQGDRVDLIQLRPGRGGSPHLGSPLLGPSGAVVGVSGPNLPGEGSFGSARPVGQVAELLARHSAGKGAVLADGGDRSELIRKGTKATALVEVGTAKGRGTGSAFCIDARGLFITNAHVVRHEGKVSNDVRLVLDIGLKTQRAVRARVLRHDSKEDLALLRIDPDPGLEALELSDDEKLFTTMRIATFGFPFGAQGRRQGSDGNAYPDVSINYNRVTSLRHETSGEITEVQFDGQINPGNSGGPVLDPEGRVVGVAAATIIGASINFAIPVGRLSAFLKAPGIKVEAPALAWDRRGEPSTWKVAVLPPGPDRPLPGDLSVSLTVVDGVNPPRKLRAEPAGSTGEFAIEFVPVPKDRGRTIYLAVRFADRSLDMPAEDRDVTVGGRPYRLGDLRHVALTTGPWAFDGEGHLIRGAVEGLGKVDVPTDRMWIFSRDSKGAPGKPGGVETVDLAAASEVTVWRVDPEKPVGSLQVQVEVLDGVNGKVLARQTGVAALVGAPKPEKPVPTNPRAILEVATRTLNGITRGTPNLLLDQEGRLKLGSELDADGMPRGSSKAIRPPKVAIGLASIAGAAEATQAVRELSVPSTTFGGFSVCFSADERLVAIGGEKSIRVLEVATLREVREIPHPRPKSLTFSLDGSKLFAWPLLPPKMVVNGRLVAWDLETGQPSATPEKKDFEADNDLRITPDGRRVLTFSVHPKFEFRLWDAETGKLLNKLPSYLNPLGSLDASGKRAVIVNPLPDPTPQAPKNNASRGRAVNPAEPPSDWSLEVVETGSGDVVSRGELKGVPLLRQATLFGVGPDATTLALKADPGTSGRILTNQVDPGTAVVRDLVTGKETRRFGLNSLTAFGWNSGGGLTPDGGSVLAKSQSGDEVGLFDVGIGVERARIKVPSRAQGLVFSPTGRIAAFLGNGLCLWTLPGRGSTSGSSPAGEAPLVRNPGGPFRAVALGGGGRYLALTLKGRRELVVFDVNAADFVKTIPLPSDDALVAAGARKLVIASPSAKRMERWDLGTLTRDSEPRPGPIDGTIHALAMGSDSDGPLLACWSMPRATRPNHPQFSFLDPDTFQVLRVGLLASVVKGGNLLSPAGGCFLPYNIRDPALVRLAASAGGATFGIWGARGDAFSEPHILRADGNTARWSRRRGDLNRSVGYLIPDAEGGKAFTFQVGVVDDPASAEVPQFSRIAEPALAPVVPSLDPAFYSTLDGAGSIAIHLAADDSKVAKVTGLEEMADLPGADDKLVDDPIGADKRFLLLPAAKLLVTIPRTNDRLVLRRLDLDDVRKRNAR